MADRPTFCQIKLIASDFELSVRFYESMGVAFDVRGPHASGELGNGVRLEVDSAQIVPNWDPQWTGGSGGNAILGFSVGAPADVDAQYNSLVAQGFAPHLKPHNAAWGKRLAIVDDPDGNPVAIMAPVADESPFDGGERQT
jgi:catechol 2,3-dioxygenase-like lactoylglutathione lyase family enzyme